MAFFCVTQLENLVAAISWGSESPKLCKNCSQKCIFISFSSVAFQVYSVSLWMRHSCNCLKKNVIACLTFFMPFIAVISFPIHSLPGKKKKTKKTETISSLYPHLEVFVLPVSKPLLFPCFLMDVAQSELHTGFSVGAGLTWEQCQLLLPLWPVVILQS